MEEDAGDEGGDGGRGQEEERGERVDGGGRGERGDHGRQRQQRRGGGGGGLREEVEEHVEQHRGVLLVEAAVQERQLLQQHGQHLGGVLHQERGVALLQQQRLQQPHVLPTHLSRAQQRDLLQHLPAVAELAAEVRSVEEHHAHALQQRHARGVRVARQQPRVQRHEEQRGVGQLQRGPRRGHEGQLELLAEARAEEGHGDSGQLGEEVPEEHLVALVGGVQHHELRVVPVRGHLDALPDGDLAVQAVLQLLPLRRAPDELVGAGVLEAEREEGGQVEALHGEGQLADLLPHEEGGARGRLLLRAARQRAEESRCVGRLQHADEFPREDALQQREEEQLVLHQERQQRARDELQRGRGVEQRAAQDLEEAARVDGAALEQEQVVGGLVEEERVQEEEELRLDGGVLLLEQREQLQQVRAQ